MKLKNNFDKLLIMEMNNEHIWIMLIHEYEIFDKRKAILPHKKRKDISEENFLIHALVFFYRELARKETQLHIQLSQTRDELRKCQDSLRSVMNKVTIRSNSQG